MVEFLLQIAILSSLLESPNFHMREAAKKNFIQINTILDISELINEASPESERAKQEIFKESLNNWFKTLPKIEGMHFIRSEDRIFPAWTNAIQYYWECRSNNTNEDTIKFAMKYYFSMLIEEGYTRGDIEEMIRRKY